MLSFGADARVLEPEWLKEQIKNEAEKIKKLYHI
ncbi:MAG: WYL domain-containing protein [Blautia marasmi]